MAALIPLNRHGNGKLPIILMVLLGNFIELVISDQIGSQARPSLSENENEIETQVWAPFFPKFRLNEKDFSWFQTLQSGNHKEEALLAGRSMSGSEESEESAESFVFGKAQKRHKGPISRLGLEALRKKGLVTKCWAGRKPRKRRSSSNKFSDEENISRIIGGTRAKLGDLPYIVSIQSLDDAHFCGGSLIQVSSESVYVWKHLINDP